MIVSTVALFALLFTYWCGYCWFRERSRWRDAEKASKKKKRNWLSFNRVAHRERAIHCLHVISTHTSFWRWSTHQMNLLTRFFFWTFHLFLAKRFSFSLFLSISVQNENSMNQWIYMLCSWILTFWSRFFSLFFFFGWTCIWVGFLVYSF